MKPDKKTIKKNDCKFQQDVLERDYMCQMCGRPSSVAHHIIPRRYFDTRWDTVNGTGLCIDCHAYAHREPEKFKKWMENRK